MIDVPTHLGVLHVRVFIGQAQSLKDKRMVLKSLKDRVRNQFSVSVAQLDGEDKWQTATLGFAMIGNDQKYIDSALQHVLSFVERCPGLDVCEQKLEFY